MVNGDLIFWGTSEICLPFLELLKRTFNLKLIVTQPDSIGGRNRKIIVPAVKKFAIQEQMDYIQPEYLRQPGLIAQIKNINAKIGVVISYGQFIPRLLYSLPELNTVNVHFSLLPLYRGAAPVQRAIENGETHTGITIFEIKKQMDSGDIWAQKVFAIDDSETASDLFKRLSQEGAPFLIETLEKIMNGQLSKIPQDQSQATFAPMVKKEEGKVNWSLEARQIFNKYRAFNPFPGLTFFAGNTFFKIKELQVLTKSHDQQPGEVLVLDRNGLQVGCGNGSVVQIIQFQPQNKKAMTPYSYSLGNTLPRRLT